MEKLKVAVIGLGWVSQNRHIPTMEKLSNQFEIVGVIDRKRDRAKNFAQKKKYSRYSETDSPEEMDWWDEIDAVVLGVPPFSHEIWAISALDKGKHVLTEKPFALTVEGGQNMVSAAEKNNRTLAVVHNFQFSKSATRLRQLVNSNTLGRIEGITAVQFGNPNRRLPTWYDDLPLGLFFDESPHLLYLLDTFSPSKIEFCSARRVNEANISTPSYVNSLYIAKENGREIPLELSLRFNSSISEWYLLVLGSEKFAMLDIFRDIMICLPNDNRHTAKEIIRTSLFFTWQHWYQHFTNGLDMLRGDLLYGNKEVFDRFYNGVRNGNNDPDKIGYSNAMRVLEMQYQIINNSDNNHV